MWSTPPGVPALGPLWVKLGHPDRDAGALASPTTYGYRPEGRPRETEYACRHCGALIGERHKTWMLEHGEWRAIAEGDGRTAARAGRSR